MKPNEPMDQAYLPTVGPLPGAVLPHRSTRRACGVLIESAHSILAGLDPSDDMAYALWHKQAVERPPQRPERAEVRPGQVVRLGRPAAGVQHGLGAGAGRLRRLRRPGRQGDADDEAGRPDEAPGQQPGDVPAAGGGGPRRSTRPRSRRSAAERDYEGLEMYILEQADGDVSAGGSLSASSSRRRASRCGGCRR